jgi:CheY-like chemotaxis protein
MERYNIKFVLAKSTDEAITTLSSKRFDAIISDMGRPPDPRAGYTLLQAIRSSGDQTPYFIYAGSRASEHVAEARRRGAQGTTNTPAELIEMVISSLRTDTAQRRPNVMRLMQLKDLIQLDYEKLLAFEKELTIAADVGAKFEVRQRIASEILPALQRHETEYADLLASTAPVGAIPEAEAQTLLDQISSAADSLQGEIPDGSPSARALKDLIAQLSKPGTASAKLKLTLPLIPLIASYEITLETAGLMMRAWSGVKILFARAAANPP